MRLDLVNFRGTSPVGISASLLSEWRVGAILQAVAVRDVKSDQLWLDIGGQRHPARIASGNGAGPQNGEQLQVRVLRNSPVLALETLTSSSAASSAQDATTAADALRRFVPRQETPALMLANLAWMAQGKNAAATLPKSVLQAAAQLWNAIPTAESLTHPQSLEAALQRSGAFLEANLASGNKGLANITLTQDLKALMLNLGKALQESGAKPAAARADTAMHAPLPQMQGSLSSLPTAPATFSLLDMPAQQLNELARQTEGAIARLTTTQLANNAPEAAQQTMLIELPVRHEDRAAVLRLRVERDSSQRNSSGGRDAWSVEAAMDLGKIGALHAKVTLVGRRIGVQLRAESPQVVEALATRAGELEALIRDSGLEIDRVVCLHGMPAVEAGPRAARLLDVRA